MAATEDDAGRVADDPEAIRKAMADTRAAIDSHFHELADRLRSGSAGPHTTNGRSDMAKKPAAKSAAKKPAAKTATATKKAPAKESPSRAKKPGPVRRAVLAAASEAKEVLGDVLAGAATGAVAGATEALADHTDEAATAVNKLAGKAKTKANAKK